MKLSVSLLEENNNEINEVIKREMSVYLDEIEVFSLFDKLYPGKKAKFIYFLLNDILSEDEDKIRDYKYALLSDWYGLQNDDVDEKFQRVADKLKLWRQEEGELN